MDPYRFPCQKGKVDWMMAYAYQHVCVIPSVNLTGYVKTVTRLECERILSHHRRSESDGEVRKQLKGIKALLPQEM